MISTERPSSFLFLVCGYGFSTGELEQRCDELTNVLQWREPGKSPVTKVSIVRSGVTSKAGHGFVLLQVHGTVPRSFTQWLHEAARQHDFVAIPSSDLFVLFLKKEGADAQAHQQPMSGLPSSLTAFLEQARQTYDALAQALLPVAAAMGDLEQDVLPRNEAFWEGITASLAAVQQASEACLPMSDKERFSWPISDAVAAALMKESVLLYHMRSRIGEVSLRLTSYRNKSSLAQRYLRQRQGVLQALCDLHKAGQDVLRQSRVWRDEIQQHSYLSPAPPTTIPKGTAQRRLCQRAGRTGGARKRHAANNSRANRGTVLYLVTKEEQREDQPDTD